MSVLILPRRFKSQPQYAAPIDYAGLGKGVQLLLNPGVGPVDLVTGRSWTASGNTGIATGQKGKVFSFDGVDDGIDHTGYADLANEGTFFAFLPRVGAPDTFGHIYLGSNSPNVCIFLVNSDGSIWIGENSHGTIPAASWFNSTNRSFAAVISPTKENVRAFIDGKMVVSSGVLGQPGWGAGNRNLRLGGYRGGANWDVDGTMLVAGYTSAAWGEAEATAFHENPWQIFKARKRKLWAVSSGGTNYTLPADPAAFALASTAASLEYNRLLAAAQGSFAVTATAATLTRGYALQADSASFTLSGADADLKYNRVLQAGSASSQIAGTDASLEYNRVLSADSGSFQIIGTDATFVLDAPGSYTLSAEPASFGISAQPATLKYNRRLSADSGSLAFTGSAASLRYARAVIAEAAVYALTGTDATFIRTGGPEPIVSTVERTAVFKAAVERAATFQRNKSVTVRFN